jgi:broad specificity phosphatase PhoE
MQLKTFFVCVALLAASCQSESTSDQLANSDSDDSTVVFLVRHGEKCLNEGDDPRLTVAGQQRSHDLGRLLSEVKLDAIYSTPFRRTIGTATPTSEMQSVAITETPVGPTFLEDLAQTLKSSDDKFILVSGHSNTTPALVNLLAGTTMDDLPDDVYDRLYIVTLREYGPSVVTLVYGTESAALTECE